jgi:hypothetical protein
LVSGDELPVKAFDESPPSTNKNFVHRHSAGFEESNSG